MNEQTADPAQLASLYHKVNALRSDIITKDWSDDKYLSFGSNGFKYLSTDKMLKTVSPLIAMHGLELDVVIDEVTSRPPAGSMEQHWTIRATVSLIDIDTGLRDVSVVYAEAADNGDKGLRKAHTIATKQWLLSKFLIADGIDDLYESQQGGTFKLRTKEEQEEAKSRVLAMGERPAKAPGKEVPKKEQVKKAKSENGSQSVPKKEPAKVPSEPVKASGEKAAQAPVEASKTAEKPAEPVEKPAEPAGNINGIPVNAFVASLPIPKHNMIERILSGKMQLHDAKAMSDEDYDRMLDQLAMMETVQDCMTFIRLYREDA